MNSRDRMDAILKGEKPDRTPVSAWRHFYHLESNQKDFVAATVGFQNKFGWDFVKINPRASYHVEGWGAQYVPSKAPMDKPQRLSYPVGLPADWEKIEELPLAAGVLAGELKTVSQISKRLGKSAYKFMTIFSPLSVAGDLVGTEAQLVRDMQESPLLVEGALEQITHTFVRFAVECLNAGAEGIFFATTEWASKNVLTEEDYKKFGRPYDLEVLEAVKGVDGRVILHVCEPFNFLPLFADYPADFVNWAASHRSNLSLLDGHRLLGKPVIGGIDPTSSLLLGRKDALVAALRPAADALRNLPGVFGAECALSPAVPDENLMALRQLVEKRGSGKVSKPAKKTKPKRTGKKASRPTVSKKTLMTKQRGKVKKGTKRR